MPAFAYRTRDRAGAPHEGVAQASDAGALAAELRRRGLLILDLAPVAERAARARRSWTLGLPPGSLDVERGLAQLGMLHRSGLTLVAGLEAVAENARRASMARVWRGVARRIRGGATFVEGLEERPRLFSPLVRELARSGEHSGTLDVALERAAAHLERRRALRATVLRALFYPTLVVALALAVTAYMVLAVVPVLQGFLQGFHRELPAVTALLITLSELARRFLPQIAVGLAALALALAALDSWPPGKAALDGLLARTPVVARVRATAASAVLARTLATLLASGVDLVQSLALCQGVLRRPLFRDCLEETRLAVLGGSALAEGLARRPAFRPLLVRMVALGERSGTLDQTLADAAAFHEAELQAWVRRAGMLVEPAITLVVGGIVGFVYIAFFLAMFAVAGGR